MLCEEVRDDEGNRELTFYADCGAHTHFDLVDATDAISLFVMSLTTRVRVREVFRRQHPVGSSIERYDEGRWRRIEYIGLLGFPLFWIRKKERYFANDHVDVERALNVVLAI